MNYLRRLLGRSRPAADPDPAVAAPTETAATRPVPTLLGYVGERSTRHVAGWVHNPADIRERVAFEVVSTAAGRTRVLATGRGDQFSRILSLVGLGDATYAFRIQYREPITPAERDTVEVRPIATGLPLQHEDGLRSNWEPIAHVAMDIVDNCNLRCPFCLYDYREVRRTNLMTQDVYDAALKLLPFVGTGHFWLSCLHEATLHPRLTEMIERIPPPYRNNVFYTTNLAKRMPVSYYRTLANSGLHHLNVSIESCDPAIYERMRKGARHRIFAENWEQLLAEFRVGQAAPEIRYIVMAYQSNLHEIPRLTDFLLRERMASNVEVRETYDVPHLPRDFRDAEFLAPQDWAWLRRELAHHPVKDVLLSAPDLFAAKGEGESGPPARAPEPEAAISSEPSPPHKAAISARRPGVVEAQISYNGDMTLSPAIAGEYPSQRDDPVRINVADIDDVEAFLLDCRLTRAD